MLIYLAWYYCNHLHSQLCNPWCFMMDAALTHGPSQACFHQSNPLVKVVAIETHACLQSQTVPCTESYQLHTATWWGKQAFNHLNCSVHWYQVVTEWRQVNFLLDFMISCMFINCNGFINITRHQSQPQFGIDYIRLPHQLWTSVWLT